MKYKVGDTVIWRGGFGYDGPKKAVIESIERCPNGGKYGEEVDEIDSSEEGVVSLDNGHWAYLDQIKPVRRGQ